MNTFNFPVRFFDTDENASNFTNVYNFLNTLPGNLKLLIDEHTSNFKQVVDRDIPYGISYNLFILAFNEATTTLNDDLINRSETQELNQILQRIGFTGDSLKLKAAIINKIWTELRTELSDIMYTLVDWGKKKIREIIEKLLKYLNSLLGSLKDLIPGSEALKELKEALEYYISDIDGDK